MKKYRKITNEDIETRYRSRYTNYRYNDIFICHSPHKWINDIIIGPDRRYTPSNLIKKLKHR